MAVSLANRLEPRALLTLLAPGGTRPGAQLARELGMKDDDPRVNPNGGAIAIGHPLGMSGARLLLTAARELEQTGGKYALATMCIGVGQGMATIIERV